MKNVMHFKNPCFLLLTALLISFSLSCKKNTYDSFEIEGDGYIRVVNTVQGSNPQDFYQNDKKVSTVAVAYGEQSDYLKISAGSSNVSFRDALSASSTVSAQSTAGINKDDRFTAFYYATDQGTGALKGISDDNTPPAAGKYRVRFVNFGSVFNNNLNINITGGNALVTGLAYFSFSNYTSLDSNTGLTVTVLGSGLSKDIPANAFAEGKIYTVWFDAVNSTTVNYHVIVQN